ncbi:hypothetical protein DL769_007007 [Monosporascus sp. CRB-8-3]|nr:hypothetical protein DL769_007007 [Monosporascus sp. CRB-8-3]
MGASSSKDIDIESFLVTYKSARESLEGVSQCLEGCCTRRDRSILLMFNAERIAKLLLEIVLGFMRMDTYHSFGSAPQLSGFSEVGSPLARKYNIHIGKFAVEDAMDREMIIAQLLRVRTQDFTGFVEELRHKFDQTELIECREKLGEIGDPPTNASSS